MTPPDTVPVANRPRRTRLLLAVSLAFLVAGLAWGGWWWFEGRWHEATDDAYVAAHVVQVTPQLGGTVLAVNVEDTQSVKAGQVLVEFDPADAQVALNQAEAALAEAVRQTRTLYANNGTLAAQVRVREAEVARWRADLARRQSIADTGAVPLEEIDHVRDALRAAEAGLAAAREQLASNQSLTAGTDVASYPAVQRAVARLEEAMLAASRTKVVAPISGTVAKRNVQVGQRIGPGTPLMAIVPLEKVWVDANFKEVQLARMRVGQPVTLHADLYGDSVRYRGTVAGFAAGTGAAFSLLPAQNATGNWIKVVQRVPVRIALEARELAAHPLRVGLSMNVDVETRDQQGRALMPAADVPVRYAEASGVLAEARKRAQDIVRRNLGRGG